MGGLAGGGGFTGGGGYDGYGPPASAMPPPPSYNLVIRPPVTVPAVVQPTPTPLTLHRSWVSLPPPPLPTQFLTIGGR